MCAQHRFSAPGQSGVNCYPLHSGCLEKHVVNAIKERTNNTPNTQATTASLEHLTGPARGTVSWLLGPVLDVSLSQNHVINFTESSDDIAQDGVIARLQHIDDSYLIKTCNEYPLWINGKRVTEKRLNQRDLIEFGDTGPLSRYQLHWQGGRLENL